MFEKTCSACGKSFIVVNPLSYTYTLKRKGRKLYYCCYSCWYYAKTEIRRLNK